MENVGRDSVLGLQESEIFFERSGLANCLLFKLLFTSFMLAVVGVITVLCD